MSLVTWEIFKSNQIFRNNTVEYRCVASMPRLHGLLHMVILSYAEHEEMVMNH